MPFLEATDRFNQELREFVDELIQGEQAVEFEAIYDSSPTLKQRFS